MLGDFTIHSVDPREEGWSPSVLFKSEIRFRILLPSTMDNWMARVVARDAYAKQMDPDAEGVKWLITEEYEVYCNSITFLIMARMNEDETFEKLVGRIEERNDRDE
jgi:hypothetical protein